MVSTNENLLNFYKNLADDTRLKLMLLLHHLGEVCVCEFTCALDLSQPKISRHLAQLKKFSLVSDRREGRWVYYHLNPELPVWCKEVLAVSFNENKAYIDEEIERLTNMGDRPERQKQCC